MSFSHILDLGSGPGLLVSDLLSQNPDLNVTCVDSSPEMLDQISSKKIRKICASLERAPIEKAYDMILGLGVLEFLDDAERFFEVAADAASPRAWLVVLYPPKTFAGRLYQAFHRTHGLHIRLFEKEEVLGTAEGSGWSICRDEFMHPYARIAVFKYQGGES